MHCWSGGAAQTASSEMADHSSVTIINHFYNGAGLTDNGKGNPNAIGTSLDDLFGLWSQDEAESFDAALEVFGTVDEAAWS